MTARDRNRLWIVRGTVIIGVMGLSVVTMYARGLGPAGRATGGASGCNAGEDVAAARDLVANPDPVELERALDPEKLEHQGPMHAVDGQLLIALNDLAVSPEDDPDLVAAFGELGIVDPVPFIDRIPLEDPTAASPFEGIFVIRTLRPAHEAIARLSELSIIDWTEPVTEIGPMSTDDNEPQVDGVGRPLQWNLDVINKTWIDENTQQGNGATIAVIDSGFLPGRLSDPEFQRPGWDFVDGDAEPLDELGHGTLVANVIAQNRDSGGFDGIAPQATLMTERVLDRDGRGTTLDLAAAVVHATLMDADVILMSLGGYHDSLLVGEALDFADAGGSILIAASGNDGAERVAFPASHPAVISVGAVNPMLETTSYTNAAQIVDVLAPGGDLTADTDGDEVADGIIAEQNGTWVTAEGTSLAAAHVAALAAVAVADGPLPPYVFRRQLRAEREDRVVDAQRVIEGARSQREGVTPDADRTAVASRLPNAPFRVQLAFETLRPAQTTCEWDGGSQEQPLAVATQRLVLDLPADLDTEVHCTSTDDSGEVVEQDFLMRPPVLVGDVTSRPDDGCRPLEGDVVDPVKIREEWTGSTGSICVLTSAP